MAAAYFASSSEAWASGEGRERAWALYIETAASTKEVRHVVEEGAHGVHACGHTTFHRARGARRRWDTVLGWLRSE
jgi:hypothetical protein